MRIETALVAADRHIDFAQRDHDAAARRRSAGRISHLVRVVDRSHRPGMAAAGHAEGFAVHLAGDLGAGIEHARDDGRVEIGNVAFQRRRAVHHRHARQHDIVLERDGLALEFAARRTLDGRFAVPGVARIVFRRRPVARRARILHHRHLVRHRRDEVVGIDRALHQAAERDDVFVRERQTTLRGYRAKLRWGGKDD